MLSWNGPGISNGYGFGEWFAERYFRDKGYYLIFCPRPLSLRDTMISFP